MLNYYVDLELMLNLCQGSEYDVKSLLMLNMMLKFCLMDGQLLHEIKVCLRNLSIVLV